MAIRVRKLAKELRRSPGEVLGLLHHLGYVNYRRADDMVPDLPADKLRRAVRQGKTAPPVAIPTSTTASAPPRGEEAVADDLMAQLVPGVVRRGTPSVSRPPPAPAQPPSTRVPSPARPATQAPPGADAEALEAQRAALVAQRDALQGRLDALEAEHHALREAHEAALARIEARSAHPDGVPVRELFEARGLRGRDEVVRGLQALLGVRRGAAVLDGRLGDAAARELEADLTHLLLLDGPPPEELTVPAVAVAEERAEGPGAGRLDRLLHELSEHMLLSGWRRLALVGVPPRWHRAIEARLDRRVEVRFQPAGRWSAQQVEAVQADLVGAVGLDVDEASLEASSATWVREDTLTATLRRLVEAARGDEG